MSDSAPADAAGVAYPPALARVLRSLLGVTYVLVLLVPVAASCEALIAPALSLLDAGVSLPASRALLNCLVLACGVFLLLLPPSVPVSRLVTLYPAVALMAFVGVWVLASLTSVCVPDSLQAAVPWLTAAVFFFASRALASSREAFELALHALLAVAAVVMLVSFRLYLSAPDEAPAITGPFYQADVAAGYFLLVTPLAVGLLIGARRRDQQLFYGLMSLGLMISLVLTYSRGGFLATLGGVVIVSALTWPFGRVRAMVIPLLVVLVSFGGAGLWTTGGQNIIPQKTLHRASELVAAATDRPTKTLAERAGQEADTSVTARANFYRGGWRMGCARPWLGWGPATFGRVFPRFQDDVRFYSKYAHSAYVTVLSEAGFCGAVALAGFLMALGGAAWAQVHAARRRDAWICGAVSGLIGSLLAVLAHVVIDVDWEFQMLLVLFAGQAGLLTSRGAAADQTEDEAVDAQNVSPMSMRLRWVFSLALMALVALQPFPLLAHFEDAAASAASKNGDLTEAVAAQRRAVAWMPLQAAMLRQLGELLLTQGEASPPLQRATREEAVACARRAVALDPCRAVNLDLLSRALLATGDAAAARQAELQALACDPVNYPRFYALVAESLMREGDDARALSLLLEIAGKYPPEMFPTMWYFRRDTLLDELSRVWYLIGTLQAKSGQGETARRAFARAVEMNPRLIVARFQLGTLSLNAGQGAVALEQFLAIQRMKPEHPVSLWLLALAYRSVGQMSRSAQLLDAACRQMPALRNPPETVQIPPDFFTLVTAPALPPVEAPTSQNPSQEIRP